EKESRYRGIVTSDEYRRFRRTADAWCAAFVWRKTKDAIPPVSEDVFRRLSEDSLRVPPESLTEIDRLAAEYRFLHWHLAFPDVFAVRRDTIAENAQTGWTGGFDVVLGNPPWERFNISQKEWFAIRAPAIATASNASERRRLIAELQREAPAIWRDW